MNKFKLQSEFSPRGDQESAINALCDGILSGKKHQTLLGVTGSGKTFTIANVIERVNRPTIVISHNKTLVAQLYGEFRALFPNNAVEFFISYYDYYQPEAYIPTTDTYIQKDADINEEIDRLRLKATSSLLQRRDVIIVASVSCIYGLGSPEFYRRMHLIVERGARMPRAELIRGRGGGDRVRGGGGRGRPGAAISPGSHYVTPEEHLTRAIVAIREELEARL